MAAHPIQLLGPQRHAPTVGPLLAQLGISGPVALITAGWQEREGQTGELDAHLGRHGVEEVRPLALFERAEQCFREDPSLLEALQRRQDRLRAQQLLYRQRLDSAVRVLRRLRARHAADAETAGRARVLTADLVDAEVANALEAVRRLDAHQLDRLAAIEGETAEAFEDHPALLRQRAAVARQLEEARSLLIAGGHVVVLRNRCHLFAVGELLAGFTGPVAAWSAGAMLLTEWPALFHDRPPQGAGNAEVFGAGLGVVSGLLVLPWASRRLVLDDPARVALLARRFAPARALTLDEGARLTVDHGGAIQEAEGVLRLHADGSVTPCRAAGEGG